MSHSELGYLGANKHITKGTVTQLTSISTEVTCNAQAGAITTVALSTAGEVVEDPFTVNNDCVTAQSHVIACIGGYADGSAGLPHVRVMSVGQGSFDLEVSNLAVTSTGDALDAAVTIHFLVIP